MKESYEIVFGRQAKGYIDDGRIVRCVSRSTTELVVTALERYGWAVAWYQRPAAEVGADRHARILAEGPGLTEEEIEAINTRDYAGERDG